MLLTRQFKHREIIRSHKRFKYKTYEINLSSMFHAQSERQEDKGENETII